MLGEHSQLTTTVAALATDGPQDRLSVELCQLGYLSSIDALDAEATARKRGARLADVLARSYGISQLSIAKILAVQHRAQLIDPTETPVSQHLIEVFGAARCLRLGVLPWRQIGGQTIVLSYRPDRFQNHLNTLRAHFGDIRMAVTTEDQLNKAVCGRCGPALARAAETKVAPDESCRGWNAPVALTAGALVLLALIAGLWFAPHFVLAALTLWTIVILLMNTVIKATAIVLVGRRPNDRSADVPHVRLPIITMLVPLYNETAIAEHLLARLRALKYPKELLDVCLVLEEDDTTTRDTLGRTILPTWMRPVVVPKGTIKTKPRALNYALDFAHGTIIGIWDAEDAPDPDQLNKVAVKFANSPPHVACLQGTLDYYNTSSNWLTRCFTLEYATWFRVILPGFRKLGLVIPLGGTTLFFRREVLEDLGGWDAHNVTEDADLGIRIARRGYETELIDTVTQEEANGLAWPWVKQRSRWLKGYAITYGVHMRNPRRLLQDLGVWRFFGVQLLFLGTLSQFVLAPVLWTFWLPVLGFAHPLGAFLETWQFWTLAGFFIASELVGFAAALVGVRKARKTWLIKWAPTLQFYFPLAALAAYKGLYELATRPFYWDKTAHGVLLPKNWKAEVTPLPQRPLRPASDA